MVGVIKYFNVISDHRLYNQTLNNENFMTSVPLWDKKVLLPFSIRSNRFDTSIWPIM